MHIVEYLYLLDYISEEKFKTEYPDVVVREVNELDIASKVFSLNVAPDIDFILDVSLYRAAEGKSVYIDARLYVAKEKVWIEEYDLVYLKKYIKEARFLVNFAREGIKLIKEEVKKQGFPLRVYDTTKQIYNISKNLSEEEREEVNWIIHDFEKSTLPEIKKEMDVLVKEENDRQNKLQQEYSIEAEKLLLNSLKQYYEKEVDKALAANDKDNFEKFSRLYVFYTKKIKKMSL